MKKLIFILLCFCLLTFGSSARIIEVAPAGAWGVLGISGGGAVAAGGGDFCDDKGSFLACEDFEGSSDCGNDGLNRQNCNETWIIVDETGTADPDFADGAFAPTEKTGAYSLLVPDPGASGQNKIKIDFGLTDQVWVAFMLYIETTTSAGTATFRFRDSTDTDVAEIALEADGVASVKDSYGFSGAAEIASVTSGSVWYVKIRVKKVSAGNSEMELWITDATSSWTNYNSSVSATNGSFTNQLRYFIINNYYTHNHSFVIDQVVIDDADIDISYFQ